MGTTAWGSTSSVGLNTAASGVSEVQTATAGQTVFTLTSITYTPGKGLQVYINGVKQIKDTAYIETSATVVTFTEGLTAGDLVEFRF